MTATRLLAAAATLALVAGTAGAAQAQSYSDQYGNASGYDNSSNYSNSAPADRQYSAPQGAEESITVTAPRMWEQNIPGESGLRPRWWPPVEARLSERVTSRGLNLATVHGAHAFRMRIRYTTRHICDLLEQRYPYTGQDMYKTCMQRSLGTNLVHADEAITNAEIRAGENPYTMEDIYRNRYGSW